KGSFFENRIKRCFLENRHKLLFTLQPDTMLEEKEDKKVADRLVLIRGKMTPSDIEKVQKDAEDLQKRQEAEENIACLPTLDLEDISPKIQTIEAQDIRDGIPAALYQQSTSGIFYFTAAAQIGGLKKDLVPLVPFFCQAFSRIGTARHDYSEMAQRIDLYTGGIGLSSNAHTRFDENSACAPFISFDGKSLVRNQDKLFDIIEELWFHFVFSDLSRLKSLLLEYRAGLESMVVANGHKLAISLAARSFSDASALNEIWHGIHQLKMVKQLTKDLSEERLASISDDLLKIGKTLFVPDNVAIALIGEAQSLDQGSNLLVEHKDLSDIGRKVMVAGGFKAPVIKKEDEIPREGWSTSTAVSFVGQSFETVRMGHEDSPALSVISKILRSKYLHREIREKGGAYGGFAIYNTEDGLFSFGSYRDPHVVGTLNVFNGASDFIRSGDYTDEDIKEAILQVCSDIDKPDSPALAAKKAFYRKLISLSDKVREDFKKNLILLNRHQIVTAARKYFNQDGNRQGVAVISGEEKLMGSNEELKDNRLMLHKI
ncbi:MAG: insulinase family protein, partial [Desulfobacterales bacterium]